MERRPDLWGGVLRELGGLYLLRVKRIKIVLIPITAATDNNRLGEVQVWIRNPTIDRAAANVIALADLLRREPAFAALTCGPWAAAGVTAGKRATARHASIDCFQSCVLQVVTLADTVEDVLPG